MALLLKTHGITRVRPLQGGAEAWLDLLARENETQAFRPQLRDLSTDA